MQTEDPDNQTNDIAKGRVSTGQDACTVQFVFACICIVAWRDSPIPEYLNMTMSSAGPCFLFKATGSSLTPGVGLTNPGRRILSNMWALVSFWQL